MSIPHTVRCRVCAIRPTTSPTKVWNVGAVKHGRNTARRPASEHGAVGPGGIDGSLSRGWWRNRRCFPLHTPRSTNHPSPACPQPTDDQQPRNCETRGVGSRQEPVHPPQDSAKRAPTYSPRQHQPVHVALGVIQRRPDVPYQPGTPHPAARRAPAPTGTCRPVARVQNGFPHRRPTTDCVCRRPSSTRHLSTASRRGQAVMGSGIRPVTT
jgi:hypothetical protein